MFPATIESQLAPYPASELGTASPLSFAGDMGLAQGFHFFAGALPMADQKRWFKVWTSLLIDMDNLPDEVIGRWTRLGCRIALVGNKGTVLFDGPEHAARFFRVPVSGLKVSLETLPNVTFEEGQKRDGKFAVSMNKWHKYQEDSTRAERQKTWRAKRREEEKRKDEKRREKKDPPLVPPAFEQFWAAYPNKKAKAEARRAWTKRKPDDALVSRILGALENQKAGDDWTREGGRFIPHPATWLNGARWEDEASHSLLTPKTAGNVQAAKRFLTRMEASRDPE